MGLRYKYFNVTGVINSTVYDTGITSTEAEKKKIKSVILSVSAYKDNLIKGSIEREEILSIQDNVVDTVELNAVTVNSRATNKTKEFALDHEIALGETFKIGILSGAVATNLKGCYKYELI